MSLIFFYVGLQAAITKPSVLSEVFDLLASSEPRSSVASGPDAAVSRPSGGQELTVLDLMWNGSAPDLTCSDREGPVAMSEALLVLTAPGSNEKGDRHTAEKELAGWEHSLEFCEVLQSTSPEEGTYEQCASRVFYSLVLPTLMKILQRHELGHLRPHIIMLLMQKRAASLCELSSVSERAEFGSIALNPWAHLTSLSACPACSSHGQTKNTPCTGSSPSACTMTQPMTGSASTETPSQQASLNRGRQLTGPLWLRSWIENDQAQKVKLWTAQLVSVAIYDS